MFRAYVTSGGRIFRCFIAPSSFPYHPCVGGSRSVTIFIDEKKKKTEGENEAARTLHFPPVVVSEF